MPTRRPLLTAALLLAALILLVLAGCDSARPTPTDAVLPTATIAPTPTPTSTPTATPTPAPTSIPSPTASATLPPTKPAATPTPPSAVSYAARDASELAITGPAVGAGAAYSGPIAEPTVEEILENSRLPFLIESSPTEIAFRGTTQPDSVRCDWQPVTRTVEQREADIRSWLGIGETEPLPSAEQVISETIKIFKEAGALLPEPDLATVKAMAYGGSSSEYGYSYMSCYIDYKVIEYFLGSGTVALTAAYPTFVPAMDYDLYVRSHATGWFGNEPEPLMSEGEHQAAQDEQLWENEERIREIVQARESVVFLAPFTAEGIAVEAWQAVAQWDVQLVDGVLQAVRYGAGDHDEEYTQTLDNLKSRITTAATTDQFAGKRIASTEGLEAYYREIGAYDDITPGDGLDNPFTPAQPPPPHPTPSPP